MPNERLSLERGASESGETLAGEKPSPAHPGYLSIRIHDLKHTFGRRLRAAGVTEEDRKALLGHKNGASPVTTPAPSWGS